MTNTRRAPRVVGLAGRLLVIWPMLGACSSNITDVEDTVPVDADKDGVLSGIDCDDNNPAVHPGATEVCNGIDDDCANGIDDGLVLLSWYLDVDGDGYGDPATEVSSCEDLSETHVVDGTDCDDNDPAFTELCPTCPDGIVTAFGEHDYVLCPDGVNQADASAGCAAMAAHLVKIETPEENDFLFDAVEPQVQSDSSAGPERFIGLNRIDTVDWRWHDGTLVGAYFPQNVPYNGDWLDLERECIVLVVGAGTGSTDSFWHPKHCDSYFPYICEID